MYPWLFQRCKLESDWSVASNTRPHATLKNARKIQTVSRANLRVGQYNQIENTDLEN